MDTKLLVTILAGALLATAPSAALASTLSPPAEPREVASSRAAVTGTIAAALSSAATGTSADADLPTAERPAATNSAPAPIVFDGTDSSSLDAESAEAATPIPGPSSPADARRSTPKTETVVIGQPERADPGAATYRVSAATIESSPRAGLLERLAQEVPGFHVSARGPAGFGIGPGAAGGIRLRGLGGSPNTEVLVLDDGVPDVMALFGHPIPDAYSPAYLRSVTVLSGGDSVLYGSGAMGGVIQLETRWPVEPHQLSATLEGGSFRTVSGRAGVLGRGGAWDWLATASALHSAGHRDFAGGDQQDALLKLRYRMPGSLTLALRQRTTLLDGFDPGTVERPNAEHRYRARRFNQALTLRGAGERLEGFATVYANVGLHRLHDGFVSEDQVLGLWLQGQARPTSTLRLTGGLDARRLTGEAENPLLAEDYGFHHADQLGLFAQGVYEPRPWASLVAGARLQHAASGLFPLFKAGLELRPAAGTSVRARAVQNFRDPTLVERFLPFPVANPALRPERSMTAELGVQQRWEHLSLTLTGYRTEAHDHIRTLGAWPAFTRQNVARTVSWGLEGAGRLQGGPAFLHLAASHAWLGPYTAQTPATKLDATLGLERAGWRAALSGELAAGLFRHDYQDGRMPDVFFLDLRVDRQISAATKVWAVARNLTDRRYAFIEGYPMPGLNLMVGLTLSE